MGLSVEQIDAEITRAVVDFQDIEYAELLIFAKLTIENALPEESKKVTGKTANRPLTGRTVALIETILGGPWDGQLDDWQAEVLARVDAELELKLKALGMTSKNWAEPAAEEDLLVHTDSAGEKHQRSSAKGEGSVRRRKASLYHL